MLRFLRPLVFSSPENPSRFVVRLHAASPSALRACRGGVTAVAFFVALQLWACSGADSPNNADSGSGSGSSNTSSDGASADAGSGSDPDAKTRLFGLRNQAKLHADRDTDEGYAEAARLLEQVVAESPESLQDRLNLARALIFTDRALDAGAHLDVARSLAPADRPQPALAYVSGIHANRASDREAALRYFTEVTEALPEHLHGWYQRAYAAERLKQLDIAEESYARVLEIDPQYRAAAYRRVIVLRQLGRDEEEKAAAEVFAALPQETQPDPEKCDLAMVDRVPANRAMAEPEPSTVSYESFETVPSGLRSLAEWTVNGSPAALIATDEGVQAIGSSVQFDWLGQSASHVLVGDLDNDESVDAVLVGLPTSGSVSVEVGFGREAGVFLPLTSMASVEGDLSRAYLIDIDHDGDLDLVGLRSGSGPGWVRNNGDRTFESWSAIETVTPAEFAESPGAGGVTGRTATPSEVRAALAAATSLDFGDFDQGNDLDLIASGPQGTMALLSLRDGTFRPVALETGPLLDFAVGDLDNDGASDLVGIRSDSDRWVRFHNADVAGKRAEFRLQGATEGTVPSGVSRVLLEDVDNDADLDLVAATSSGLAVLPNEKGRTFGVASTGITSADGVSGSREDGTGTGGSNGSGEDGSGTGGSDTTGSNGSGEPMFPAFVGTSDLDDDGRVELWSAGANGAQGFSVEAINAKGYDAWRMRPKGARDNVEGIGTVVEQFAGDIYQARMIRNARGVRLGLAGRTLQDLDGVRLRWPQGIIQSELQAEFILETEREFRPTQDEGLVASCPFLYAEGPEGWHFLTDVVGIAPLDEWLPPGGTAHQDPEEFVRIDAKDLVVRDGRVRLAITEELRETTYLDRVELWWVDHPSDHVLYLDESTNQGAYDPLRVYALPVSELQPARNLRTSDGADATSLVESGDFRYVHGYGEAPSQWSGWVEPYSLELTAPAGAATLLLTGRIHWYDSTVSYALHQNGRGWSPLRLETVGEEGRPSRVLVPDVGLPAGMDRTLVSSWSEPLAEDTRLRLSGQFRFLWDRISFASPAERYELSTADGEPVSGAVPLATARKSGPRADASLGATPAESASKKPSPAADGALLTMKAQPATAILEFHGYSQIVGDKARHEQTYVYDAAGPDDVFARAWGPATRYGDVRPLLDDHDDELAVLVAGDRVVMEFDVTEPPRQAHRTYFLKISGWAKEGSYHNRTGRWIEPLPFRGMSSYPPPQDEVPEDESYKRYLESYQTRYIAGGE